jgi:phosphate transport system protein
MEENLHIDRHISRRFNDELEALRTKVLRMGGLVEQQCSQALTALVRADIQLAQSVATSDYQVNELEVEISAQCADILARRQPAASDLRMILAVIRMIADLERIGDEAEKIARLALKLAAGHEGRGGQSEPQHLGDSAIGMLRGALDAFAHLDVEAAIGVAALDRSIDEEFDSLTRVLITHMMEDPQRIKNMLRMNWCARSLERIGDHAVNICEQVVYLVKGSDVRHLSLEEIQQRYLQGD